MPRVSAEHVEQAVERLKRAFHPLAIYHFGSSSRGTDGPDSDLDLLVIVHTSDLTFFQRCGEAYRVLYGVNVPIDVLVYTQEEFRGRAATPMSLEKTVATTGRLVHAA